MRRQHGGSATQTIRVSAVVIAVAGALFVAFVVPAPATFQGRNGLIAYAVGGGEDDFFLRTVKADGTRNRRVIGPSRPGGDLFRGPAGAQWSADGKRVMFGGHTHLDGSAVRLWHATAAGKRITEIPLGLRRPLRLYGWSWAPDGRRVVFAAGRPQGPVKIYTIAIDGSHRRTLTRGERPAWSGDGRYIVFQRGPASVGDAASKEGVFIVRPTGRGLRRLTQSDADETPSFSPDSRQVVLVRFFGYPLPTSEQRVEWHIVGVDGRQDVLVATHYPALSRFRVPQWTPDGTRLAAIRDWGGDFPFSGFVTVDPTGADERVAFRFPIEPSPYTYYDGDFSWRPR